VREKAMTVEAHLETMSDLKKVVLFLDGFPVHLEDLEGKIGNILILTH
jgi:nitrate reductase NapAB chaperone NapD